MASKGLQFGDDLAGLGFKQTSEFCGAVGALPLLDILSEGVEAAVFEESFDVKCDSMGVRGSAEDTWHLMHDDCIGVHPFQERGGGFPEEDDIIVEGIQDGGEVFLDSCGKRSIWVGIEDG